MKQLLLTYHFFLAWVGNIVYGFPSRHIKVVGITGTKGKTTSVALARAMLGGVEGRAVASLSSAQITVGSHGEKNKTGNSMPGRMFIQKFLRDAVRAGCEYAVVEVTSQGVEYHRHRFIRWDTALITNIQPEHIEAHGSFEKYREAKASFLRYVAGQGGKIFINHDDQACEYFFQNVPADSVVMYSATQLPEFLPLVWQLLPGQFNKENVAGAVALARFYRIQDEAIARALESFSGVPGRMEYVQREPFAVIVDYAHTPDSLLAAYQAVKPKTGKLICVLGAAGGGRDKWKREVMGKIAGDLCDEIVLTNEDPYNEDPTEIIRELEKGINASTHKPWITRELDRKAAIRVAIEKAKPGDVVMLTGKGSESFIHLAKGEKMPWNEREVVEELLKIADKH